MNNQENFENVDFDHMKPKNYGNQSPNLNFPNPNFGQSPGNPLKKYFRAPGMHITLPSHGYYSNSGDMALTINSEIPVFPMTAADELLLKSPDALLNGYAIQKLIESCVPAVRNVLNLPSPDVDAILLAIRSSTYGDKLEMNVECPKCKYQSTFSASIRTAIESAKMLDPEYPIRISEEVLVYVKPYTFESNTIAALVAFEQAKSLQLIEQQDMPDTEKLKIINSGYEKVSELNLELNAKSILSVIIPEGVVVEYEFIHEFLKNTDKNSYKKIDDKIKEINEFGVNKNHHVVCENCKHEWESELVFDPARFFG